MKKTITLAKKSPLLILVNNVKIDKKSVACTVTDDLKVTKNSSNDNALKLRKIKAL